MTVQQELAAKWREEIERLERSVELWESGRMHAYIDGKDVTAEQAPELRRHVEALREAIAILEQDRGAS